MAARGGDERSSRLFRKTDRYTDEVASLGANVRALRLKKQWTLEQAAEQMLLDLKHLQKVEAGLLNITMVTLVRVADGLGVPVRALFSPRATPRPRAAGRPPAGSARRPR